MQLELFNGREGNILEELNGYMREKKDVLTRMLEGEGQYGDSLGWFHVEEWAGEERIREIEAFAERVLADGDILVVIGIGGSNQAARAVIRGLSGQGRVKIVFAGNNLSASYTQQILEQLAGKSVYINVIAKNFETLEPGLAFRFFRQYLKNTYGAGYGKRVFVTGTRGSRLHSICLKHGFSFLDFPETIGGRYSGLCNVGLFPMAAAGIPIRSLIAGARDMELELKAETGERNIAFRYAAIRNLLYQKGFQMELLASFEPELQDFYGWWTQLFAESEGKEGKGLFPVGVKYSEDLHSIGQFVQEGAPIIFETFLEVKKRAFTLPVPEDEVDDGFDYISGSDLAQISRAAFTATMKAHGKRLPCLRLEMEELDAYGFGRLFYFFEFACYLSGRMLGVNPFDQPGVEDYKSYMFEALGKCSFCSDDKA